MRLNTKLLYKGARLPERGHDIDVGLDVFTPYGGVLKPGANTIPLGISIEVPIGYSAEIRPRTGMASGAKTLDMTVVDGDLIEYGVVRDYYENGIALLAQSPPIDPGYTGEINAIVYNGSSLHIAYDYGTRFGQLVVYPIAYPYCEVDEPKKVRGDGKFGSTGIGTELE